MKVIYIAHPLNAPTRADIDLNRANASRWCAYLAARYEIAPVADWIVLSGVWTEEEGRALGLEIDKAIIDKCDELWMVGGRVSSGMGIESTYALETGKSVLDLTSIGYALPLYADDLNALDRLVLPRAPFRARAGLDSLPEGER